MAKFLNKKEQVIDFKLTPYGKQRLSVGKLKPVFYSFFDDGILYDSQYAGFTEKQNDINNRIKNETQFIEGILSFTDIETFPAAGNYLEVATTDVGTLDPADQDISPPYKNFSTDKFSYNSSITDVIFDAQNAQLAPATKLVTCQGQIVKIKTHDETNYDFNVEETVENLGLSSTSRNYDIPQIDINVYYTKQVDDPTNALAATDMQQTVAQTSKFADGKVIKLIKSDLVVYAEEMNTEMLNENFDIEVFEVKDESEIVKLERKFFKNRIDQIQDGFMLFQNPVINRADFTPPDSVEYYFDVLTDKQVDAKIACGCASNFNKESYYVDLDIDCEKIQKQNEIYYDIYGSVTVPEICQPTGGPNGPTYTEDGEIADTDDNCGDV
tara:strand:+ start:51742 stop:52890 length:1149 start_codon:yes stop_codon:yes gene_type:complete